LFDFRFVFVLSFWCLTSPKPLKLRGGATPAGIANDFNGMRDVLVRTVSHLVLKKTLQCQ